MADFDTDFFFFTSKLSDSDLKAKKNVFKQQIRKNESIHKQYVYLVFNRPNQLLAIENNNCNHQHLAFVFKLGWNYIKLALNENINSLCEIKGNNCLVTI